MLEKPTDIVEIRLFRETRRICVDISWKRMEKEHPPKNGLGRLCL
jgi:hypothetical protein